MTSDVGARARRMPLTALVAGVLGILAAGAMAVVLLAVLGLARWGGSGVPAWLLGMLAVPPLQVIAAVVLLRRRGWLPLALATLPGVLLSARLLWSGDLSLASPAVAGVVLPVPLLVLTLLPATRAWAARAAG